MRFSIFFSMFVATSLTGCGEKTIDTKDSPAAGHRRDWRPDPAGDQPIPADSATLWVKGLSCPLCANNIDKQLKRVPGVTEVRVDLGDGKVSVSLAAADRPSRNALARAVHASGFTLDRIETP